MLFMRNKPAVILTFIVPMALIYLMGHVFGVYGKRESGPTGIVLAVVDQSHTPAATRLIQALRGEKAFDVWTEKRDDPTKIRPFTEEDVREGLRSGRFHYALIIPADLISTERIGVHLKFLTDPRNEIETQMVNGLLQQAIFTKAPQLLGQSLQSQAARFAGEKNAQEFNHNLAQLIAEKFGGDAQKIESRISNGDFGLGTILNDSAAPTNDSSGATSAKNDDSTKNVISRLFRFESEQVTGQKTGNPMGARLVGGYAVMFLLFAVSRSAAAMFEEKRTGIFQRILAAPVTPSQIVWARFIFGVVLGVIQISALFLAGRLFYGLDVLPHVVPLLVVTVCASAACTAFGMLLAAFAPDSESVQGLATLLVILMSAVGGAWFPVSIMPAFMQKLSKFTVVYWSVEGFTSVVWAGQSVVQVLPNILALSGIAIGIMAISLLGFRRSKMFD